MWIYIEIANGFNDFFINSVDQLSRNFSQLKERMTIPQTQTALSISKWPTRIQYINLSSKHTKGVFNIDFNIFSDYWKTAIITLIFKSSSIILQQITHQFPYFQCSPKSSKNIVNYYLGNGNQQVIISHCNSVYSKS